MCVNLISVPVEKGLSVELPQEDDIEKYVFLNKIYFNEF